MPRRIKPLESRMPVHRAAMLIRRALGFTKKRMANETGCSHQEWAKYESGTRAIPFTILEAIRVLSGIDAYVLAYCLFFNHNKLPGSLQKILSELRDEWLKQIEIMTNVRHKLPAGYW